MTNLATPAQAGSEAQPMTDANSIDSIVDKAISDSNPATTETTEAEPVEPNEPADNAKDDTFPKKAVNALSRRDKQIGKQRAQIEQLNMELSRLREQSAPKQTQQTPNSSGEPKETDFNNYADYMRAIQKFDLQQEIAKLEGKQQQTQQTTQEQVWVSQRVQVVAQTVQAFIKENPDAQALIEEHADIVDEYSPQLQHLFLEADNAPLAFYNLAKEGKLEDLANMSLAKAAMEIGRAQTQAPAKPTTKAPTPLPASRGSVASGKRIEDMNGSEIRSWLKSE